MGLRHFGNQTKATEEGGTGVPLGSQYVFLGRQGMVGLSETSALEEETQVNQEFKDSLAS